MKTEKELAFNYILFFVIFYLAASGEKTCAISMFRVLEEREACFAALSG